MPTGVSDSVVDILRHSSPHGRLCSNHGCQNDDRTQLTVVSKDDRGYPSEVQCSVCGTVTRACLVDPGVITLLRRHSIEDTVCAGVGCPNDDPARIAVVGDPDEFGYPKTVDCVVCGLRMSTRCYDSARRRKMRVHCMDELQHGDHIAWHTILGHWHNAIFVEAVKDRKAAAGKSQLLVINYRFTSGCRLHVRESVFKLDLFVDDVYRVIYADAYTNEYSVERARRLTRPEVSVHPLTGGCEDLARWCKTGHRESQVGRLVQKLSAEKEQLNVIHKTSTFVSMAIAEGLIPDSSSTMQTAETVIFTVIPAIVFFFSIAMAQMKREHDEIKPRPENVVVRGSACRISKSAGSGGGCCSCCDCDVVKENSIKRCRSYIGPMWRIFLRELIALGVPVVTFVLVNYYVGAALPDKDWIAALCEVSAALVAMPISYIIAVLVSSLSERYCCRCLTPSRSTFNCSRSRRAASNEGRVMTSSRVGHRDNPLSHVSTV